MRKRKRIIVGVALAVTAVLLLSLFALVGFFYLAFLDLSANDQEHLPDEALIQNFHHHRSDFEKLRSMLERDDHIFRIDDDWTYPDDIPRNQVEEYRRLFAVVGTPRGFYNRRNPLRLELIASARGMVTSGSTKSYVYGAGKSTLAPALLRDTFGILEFVNADTIAEGLSAFAPQDASFDAGRVMLGRLHELAEAGKDFAFETTLASRF